MLTLSTLAGYCTTRSLETGPDDREMIDGNRHDFRTPDEKIFINSRDFHQVPDPPPGRVRWPEPGQRPEAC